MKSALIDSNGTIQFMFDFSGEPENYPTQDGYKLLVGIEDYNTFNYRWNGFNFEKINKNIKGISPVYIKEI